MVDFLGIHVFAQRDLDLPHPGESGDLALHIGGHQEGEVCRAPIGRQAEADRYGAVRVHGQTLNKPQIRDGFIQLGIGHAIVRQAGLRLAL